MSGRVTFVLLFVILILFFANNVLNAAETNGNGHCDYNITQEYVSKCNLCFVNKDMECKDGHEKVTEGEGTPGCVLSLPEFHLGRTGCRHTCRRIIQMPECCPGYWGSTCQECPGSWEAPCNGHGLCNDRRLGTGVCNCTENWTGYSCEICKNDTVCGETLAIASCQNHTCPINSKCVDLRGEPECVCEWPYVYVNKTENATNTLSCKDMRTEVCNYAPLCHQNATCTPPTNITFESLSEKCTCNEDFIGDGFDCDLLNPCQVNNGGCHNLTSICIPFAPGKRHCSCLPGYEEHVDGVGCTVTDMCDPFKYKFKCHTKAICETVGPLMHKCTCMDGYVGDGRTCYSNIMQTIDDLDKGVLDAEVTNQLSLIHTAMDRFYSQELTDHGLFTIFLPMNEGFRGTTTDFQKWLDDESRVKQVLRQHIIVGQFTVEHLLNHTDFFTLQGTPASIMVNSKGSIRYKLRGDSKRARIVKGDVLASNGIVHVVNKLMNNDPVVDGNQQKTVLELIEGNGQYNKLQALIAVAGSEIEDILTRPNVTVFAANNGVWEALPAGSLDYLKTPEGRGNLIAILKNLVYDGKIEIAELINTPRITTLSSTTYAVSVTDKGRVQLDGAINITHADIVASNGFLMELDAVPIPEGFSTLPNFCVKTSYKVDNTSRCVSCGISELKCHTGDLVGVEDCQFGYYLLESQEWKSLEGCKPLCNMTVTERECCDGFFGVDCLPCNGGYKTPCSGNGKCFDGINGNGTCQCDANFKGETCSDCIKGDHFGPTCEQVCTCLYGVCDNGPYGNGMCRTDRLCESGSTGPNCDRKMAFCDSTLQRRLCHAHAVCVLTETGNRCVCSEGYTMQGEDCVELNPCLEPYRGDCDKQATCIKTGPGKAKCSCNLGWTGNGHYCYRASACRHHAECSVNATCIDAPIDNICQCRTGFHGNGTTCIQEDICIDNVAGCHPKAICNATGPGKASCTCNSKEGYVGTGYDCYGDIVQQIESHPNLTFTANLLRHAENRKLRVFTDYDYTIFVPNDQAMINFRAKYRFNDFYFKTENLIPLFNYHMLMNGTKIEILAMMENYTRLKTMQDGFNLHIQKQGETYSLVSPATGIRAAILEQNLMATNGYINIIDQVLEPYLPTNPDDYPLLSEFFDQNPQYSIFGQWLQDHNLTSRLEDEFIEYTLFVPNNEAAKNMQRTVTTDYLLYYVIPTMQLTAAVVSGETFVTSLGPDHQLVYNVLSWENITINNVHIEKQDVFTFGGIVNGISDLLNPVLHECTEKVSYQIFMSECTACIRNITCPDKYTPAVGPPSQCIIHFRHSPYDSPGFLWTPDLHTFHRPGYNPYYIEGCQVLCVPSEQVEIKGCCAGYFGWNCQECPGGPQFPCSGHGTCDDRINGTGVCACQPKFTGDACDSCIEGWTGANCGIDKSSCKYKNGGCHENADCVRDNDGVISCSCSKGYYGDGYNCTGPCDVGNGGCHDNASCSYLVTTGVDCTCQPGFYGDGKVWCNGDITSTLQNIGTVNTFLTSVQQWLPDLGSNTTTNSTYTLFIPDDQSLNDKTLDREHFLSHIVQSNETINLSHGKTENITVSSMSGEYMYIWFDTNKGVFYVNKTAIIEGNIPYQNGMIHLLSSPLAKPYRPSLSKGLPIGAIVGAIVGCLLVAMVIAGSVVAYKRSQFRYWKLMQNWYPRRKQSDNSGLEAPLNFSEIDEDNECGSPTGNTKFGNPLYQVDDLE